MPHAQHQPGLKKKIKKQNQQPNGHEEGISVLHTCLTAANVLNAHELLNLVQPEQEEAASLKPSSASACKNLFPPV